MIESINVVIDDSDATRMVESKDNDVFEKRCSTKNFIGDKKSLFLAITIEPPRQLKIKKKSLLIPNGQIVLILLTTLLVILKEELRPDARFKRH